MTYTQHPLSAAFPSMPEADLLALAEDISKNGQHEPGVLFEGQVLDGWHRHEACKLAGVEFVAVEYTGSDPVAFVISRNAHRRHLTASQRAAAVVMCAEWAKPHRPKKGEAASPFSKNEDLAKAAGTTVRTVQQAKRAVEAGFGDAVRDGQMSAEVAVAVAKGKEPKAKARQEPTQEPDEGPTLSDIVDEQERTLRERDAQIAALSADDKGEELLKQVKLTQHYQREIGIEQDKNARLMRERDEAWKWRNKVCDAVGEPKPSDALAAIRRAFAKEAA